MRILMVHGYYRNRGGEDVSTDLELELLRSRGHPVELLAWEGRELSALPWSERIRLPLEMTWSWRARARIQAAIRRFQPEVVYFQNTFPWISPAGFSAARELGLPVVAALRNFRSWCASATMTRAGRPCGDCPRQGSPWPAVQHRCYHGSLVGSAAVAVSVAFHQWRGTWDRDCDAYLVSSEFARQRLVELGFEPARLHVRPEALGADPGVGQGQDPVALFVGRLDPGKGVETLLAAWSSIGDRMPLELVGTGELASQVASLAERVGWLRYLGPVPHAEVLRRLRRARLLVMPSEVPETFGRAAAEALACGTPAIVSRIGALPEIVEHRVSGLHVTPGDPEELARAVLELVGDEALRLRLAAGARRRYLERFQDDRVMAGLLAALEVA